MLIIRTAQNEVQTIGHALILDNSGQRLETFTTLELPFINNFRKISCIPPGEYKVKKRFSKKFGNHFHVLDVKGRDFILIHKGNYYTQTKGCILLGREHKYINNDNVLDVSQSAYSMALLNRIAPIYFTLKIVELW